MKNLLKEFDSHFFFFRKYRIILEKHSPRLAIIKRAKNKFTFAELKEHPNSKLFSDYPNHHFHGNTYLNTYVLSH